MLLLLICCRTQSPQGNATSLEGAGMGSHKTCHFPNTSPKHSGSSSPCSTDPHAPPVHKEKGTTIFCGRASGCCQQKRTTAPPGVERWGQAGHCRHPATIISGPDLAPLHHAVVCHRVCAHLSIAVRMLRCKVQSTRWALRRRL